MKEQLKQLWEDERGRLNYLARQIMDCAKSIKLVCEEAETGAKREMTGGEPHATIQVTPLQDSSTEKLQACIAEYNARLLWRKAIEGVLIGKK